MARTVRSPLEHRSNRLKLSVRREPHWTRLAAGEHVGYRRLAVGSGTWIAKYRAANGQRFYEALGSADDFDDSALTFAQAQAKAREFFSLKARQIAGGFLPGDVFTVGDAMADYLADRTARGDKGVENDRHSVTAHILPELGKLAVAKLTRQRLVDWHRILASQPARVRSRRGEQAFKAAPTGDQVRGRRSTANRVLAMLKAALNAAHHNGKVPHDDAWRHVRPFGNVSAARLRFLSDDECRRLLNATDGTDVGRLITAGLLTGARYGELVRLRARDFNGTTLFIAESKSGKPRHVSLTDEGRRFFARQCAGNAPTDRILTIDGEAWTKGRQQRPFEEACKAARIERATIHALRHTHASRLIMRGATHAVVAEQLGHASIAMVQKHYGHLSPSHVSETIRASLGEFGIAAGDNVVPLEVPEFKFGK